MSTKRAIRIIPVIAEESSQWKFGPVSRNEYMSALTPTRNEAVPYVTVKRRDDGKYVVVEKYPKKLKPVTKIDTFNAPLSYMDYSSEVKLRSIKPDWKYSPRHKVFGDYDDSSLLPPIDLGWTSESKIGSWDNIGHTPRGGDKQIFREKLRWAAKSKIGSLDNVDFIQRTGRSQSDPTSERTPRESPRKIKVTPRYGAVGDSGAFGNKHYTPGGAEVKLPSLSFNHVKPKVGSLDYVDYQPLGGNVRIPHYSTKWNVESKVGSLDNVHHKPGGGDIIFLQEKLKWNARSKVGSLENITHRPQGGHRKIPSFKLDWRSGPKVGSFKNIGHMPGGGLAAVEPKRVLNWKAESKIETKHKKKKKMPKDVLNMSFDSLDSYECEYVELVAGGKRKY